MLINCRLTNIRFSFLFREMLCMLCRVISVWKKVFLCQCCVFCPVSLCLGWWKSARRATQRKGFTWVKHCWRMASCTMVSSNRSLLSLSSPQTCFIIFCWSRTVLERNLPQASFPRAARCRDVAWPNLWPSPINVPHLTSFTILSPACCAVQHRTSCLIYVLAGVTF